MLPSQQEDPGVMDGDPAMSWQSPFERLLGADFTELPAPVKRLHALRAPLQTAGRADVVMAAGLVAQIVCRLAGLPPSGHDIPASVHFKPDGTGGEHWERQFGDRRYASFLAAGKGRDQGLLIEQFGPFNLRFRLTAQSNGLAWSIAGWRLGALPLPAWSAPRIECLEGADGDRFTFDIDVAFPVIGSMIHYKGWLAVVPARVLGEVSLHEDEA